MRQEQSQTLSEPEVSNWRREAAKLSTKAVTNLEPSEIPQLLFFLADDESTDRELCLTDDEIVLVPTHLGILDSSILFYACILQ